MSSPAAQAQKRYGGNPHWASMLGRIASAPSAHRFWMWNMSGNIAGQVAHYLEATQVQEPGRGQEPVRAQEPELGRAQEPVRAQEPELGRAQEPEPGPVAAAEPNPCRSGPR